MQLGRRVLVLYVLGVLCLGAIVIATLREDGSAGRADQPAPMSAGTTPTDGAGADGAAGEDGGTPASPRPGAPPTDGAGPGPGGIEAAPEEETTLAPGEAVASGRAEHGMPLVPAAPGPEAREGGLVDEHPRRVLPPAPGTRVLASSVSPSPGRLQVAFTAQGESGPVLAFYRRHLADYGFQEVASTGDSALFTWRRTSVTVSTAADEGTYAVFAVLRTRGS